MKKEIHFETWWDEMNQRISAFHSYWTRQHSEDGKNFPNFLSSGDWDEQFSFFVENVYDPVYGTKETRERREFKN